MADQTNLSSSAVPKIEASCPDVEVQSDWPAAKVYEGSRLEHGKRIYSKMTMKEQAGMYAFIHNHRGTLPLEKVQQSWLQSARYRLFLAYLRNAKWSFRSTIVLGFAYAGLNVAAMLFVLTKGEPSVISVVESGALAANALVNVQHFSHLYKNSTEQLNALVSHQGQSQQLLDENTLANEDKTG